MRKKTTRDKVTMDKLRLKAKIRYLESGGQLTLSQLSKEIHTTRQTVSKWKNVDNWDADLTDIRQEVDTKLKKAVAANLFDDLVPEYKEVANNIRVLNSSISQKLWKRDKEGRVLRDSSGQPQINTDLEPKELRHISMIMSTNLKTMRLLAGQSTENIEQSTTHSGKLEHTHQAKGVIDDCLDKMRTGEINHADGQDALFKLATAFQSFREEVSND